MADDDRLFADAFAAVEHEGVVAHSEPACVPPRAPAVRAPIHPAFRPRQNLARVPSQNGVRPVHAQQEAVEVGGQRNLAVPSLNGVAAPSAVLGGRNGVPSNLFYAGAGRGGWLDDDVVQITKQTVNPVFARAHAGNKWNSGLQQQRRKPGREDTNEFSDSSSRPLIQPPTKVARGKQSSAVVFRQYGDDVSRFRYGTVTHQNVPDHYTGFDVEAGSTWIYPINFPRREYQFTICEHALFYNTLVSLPTGLGKTFIAAVIMYNFYRWYPDRKILFAAPTRPLVAQQMRACYEVMGVPQHHMAELTGAMSPADRMAVWRDRRMLFLTPQVIKNDLTLMSIQPEEIICIVFDEAHAAHGNHAYCSIVREMIVKTTQFRVLALSATPGKNRDSIQEVIKNLLISRVDIRTNESMDIQPYTHARRITVDIIKYDAQTQDFIDRFQAVINNYIKRLKTFGAIPDHMPNHKLSPFLVLHFQKAFKSAPTRVLNKTMLAIAHADFALLQSLTRAGESLRFYGLRSFWRHMVQFLDGQRGNSRVKSELVLNPVVAKLQTDVCRALRIEDDNVSKLTQQQNSGVHRQTHAAYQRTLLNMSLGRHGASSQSNQLGLMPSASQEQQLMLSPPQPTDNFVYGHPKMQRLEEIVLEHFGSHENELRYRSMNAAGNKNMPSNGVSNTTRCIVFVQFRDSCAEITTMLERHEPLIRASMFVGQSSRGMSNRRQNNNFLDGEDDIIMDEEERRQQFLRNKQSGRVGQKQREQLAVIQKFRSGELNTIVATCVGEEGLDVGEVDLIICYDMQKSPVRMVQRMGRTGRKREGRIVVLLTEGLEEERYIKANQSKDDAQDQLARTADFVYYHDCPRLVPRDIRPRIEEVMLKQRAFEEKPVKQTKSKLHAGNDSGDDLSGKKSRKTARLDDWLKSGVLHSGAKKAKKCRANDDPNSAFASTAQVYTVDDDDPLRLTDAQMYEYQLKYQCELPNDVKLPPNRLQFGTENVAWPNFDRRIDGSDSSGSGGSSNSAEALSSVTYARVPMQPVGVHSQDTRRLRLAAFGSAYQSLPTPTFALQHTSACGTLVRANKLFEHFRTFGDGDDNAVDQEVELFERGGFEAVGAAHAEVPFDIQYIKAGHSDYRASADGDPVTDENDRNDLRDEDFAVLADFEAPHNDCYGSLNKSQNFIVSAMQTPNNAVHNVAVGDTLSSAVRRRSQNDAAQNGMAGGFFVDERTNDAVLQFQNETKVDNIDFDDDMLAELNMDTLEQNFEQEKRITEGERMPLTNNTSLNSALRFLQPTQQQNYAVRTGGVFAASGSAVSKETANVVHKVTPDVIEETPPPAPVVSRTIASTSLRCDEVVGISSCYEDSPLDDSFFDAAFYADSLKAAGSKPVADDGAMPKPHAPSVPSPRSAVPSWILGSLRKNVNLIGLPRHSSTPRHVVVPATGSAAIDASACSHLKSHALSPGNALDVLSPIRSLSALADNTLMPQNSVIAIAADDDCFGDVEQNEKMERRGPSVPVPMSVTDGATDTNGNYSSIYCKQKLDFDGSRCDQVDSFSMFHDINNEHLTAKPPQHQKTNENTPRTANQQIPASSSSGVLGNKFRSTPTIPNGINYNGLAVSRPQTAFSPKPPTPSGSSHMFRSPFLSPLRVHGARSTSLLSSTAAASSSGKRLGMTGGVRAAPVLHQQQTRFDADDDGFPLAAVPPRPITTISNGSKQSPKSADEKIFKNWRCRAAAVQGTSNQAGAASDDSPIGKNAANGDEQRPAAIRRRRPKPKSAYFSEDDSPTDTATAPAAVADDSVVAIDEDIQALPTAGRRVVRRQASLPSPSRQNSNAGARRRPRRQRNEFVITQAEVSDEEDAASADEGEDIHYDQAARQQEAYEAEMSSFINHDEPTQTGIDVRQLYAQEMRARDAGLSVDGFMEQLRERARRNAPRYSPRQQHRIDRLGYDPNIYSQPPDEDELNDTYDEGDGFVVKD